MTTASVATDADAGDGSDATIATWQEYSSVMNMCTALQGLMPLLYKIIKNFYNYWCSNVLIMLI